MIVHVQDAPREPSPPPASRREVAEPDLSAEDLEILDEMWDDIDERPGAAPPEE